MTENVIKPRNPQKATTRILLNNVLIAVAIGAFFLTIDRREELLHQRIVLLQLVLAIPLLLMSVLSYTKVGYRTQIERWERLAWVSFVFGYAFILNVIGILVSDIIGDVVSAIAFFSISWLLALLYSLVDILYDKRTIRERMTKDALFISVQLPLGLLVALNVY